ncbi:MAG: hypothetical protein ABSE73_12575 [Planctomycetota bacterium]
MVIVYCDKCGVRVSESDLDSGTAVKTDVGVFYCVKCAPTMAPAKKRASPAAAPHTPAAPAKLPALHLPAGKLPAQEQARQPMLMAAGVVGAAVLVAGVILLLNYGKPEPSERKDSGAVTKQPDQPASTAQNTAPESKTPPGAQLSAPGNELATSAGRKKAAEREDEQRLSERAATLLREHKAWFKEHPQDPWGYKERLSQLASTYRSFPAGVEAAKILAELKFPERPAVNTAVGAGKGWDGPSEFSKGDFAALGWQVEGAWDIFDYKAGRNNPGSVARYPAHKPAGKLTKIFDEAKDPKRLELSLDVGWGWGDAGQGSDAVEFLLLDAQGNGYVFHVGRANANWAVQWAAVQNNEVHGDRHWAPGTIDGSHPSVRDGGGLERVTVTREGDGSWTLASKEWNKGAGGSVKFNDKTTTSFSRVVLLGAEQFDEQVFNNIVLEITK